MSRCVFWQWRSRIRASAYHRIPPLSRRLPFRRAQHNPADNPNFRSIVDNPPIPVRIGHKGNPILLTFMALIPITAFALGTWQVYRLDWKTKLIAKFEDRITKPPLPLPPRIDPSAIPDFDYRRITTTGVLLHSQEMLIGPRMHDGNDGFLVITPLQRSSKSSNERATILVNRGWIAKDMKYQWDRDKKALPEGEVRVEGLLREPFKKNLFTPENAPKKGKWHFPDVAQMAEHVGSEAVWVEETMGMSFLPLIGRGEPPKGFVKK
ncbi:MAG: hypothetical protein Q9227_001756 [Pyrenula ochraceoflavens]